MNAFLVSRRPWISISALATLVLVFVLDVFTPQTLVVAILLNVPIALASFASSRRLTSSLVVLALAANAVAAYVNGIHDGYRWDTIGLTDRLLAAISIVLVGFLSTEVQERAGRVGRLAAQEARGRREALLAGAADRIRASLSLDLVYRAIVREAPVALDADAAWLFLAEGTGGTLTASRGVETITLSEAAPAPSIISLGQRAFDSADALAVRDEDPVGRLILDGLGAAGAIAVPLLDRERRYGLLIAGFAASTDESALATARTYARLAVNALAQAQLFSQLAERNDAIAERGTVIRDLVYAISHDLRTPLAALGMTLKQAKDGAYGAMPVPYIAILDQSIIATDDLQRLAETLLLVARFESGERHAERERIDAGDIVRQIAGEFAAIAGVREVTLSADPLSDLITLGDRGDVRRAVANLTANALDHTPAGGHVTITAAGNDRSVDIVVEDDGYGVSDEMRAQLFHRFARGEGRRGGGSGLGLYIVRRVAHEMGGDVRYEPNTPRGSRFILSVPRERSA